MEISYLIPTVCTLLFGGYLYTQGQVSLGDVTAATLYVQMLIDPVDRIISILDELQMGAASLARLLGVAAGARRPRGHRRRSRSTRSSRPRTCGSRTSRGATCCTASTSTSASASGSRWSGRPAPASRTLGRLLAGIHPPRTGSVTVGGVGLVELPLGDLRGHVALVTQEHHVFVGTLRENLALAAPPGADRGRHPLRARRGRRPRLGRRPARRARHRGRLRRPLGHRRPGPADRAGPAGARRPAHPGARRGNLAHRPARGPAPRALAGRGARRPHGDRDRPPALLGARRRPGRRGRGRRDLRARLARRAGRRWWVLRRPAGTSWNWGASDAA